MPGLVSAGTPIVSAGLTPTAVKVQTAEISTPTTTLITTTTQSTPREVVLPQLTPTTPSTPVSAVTPTVTSPAVTRPALQTPQQQHTVPQGPTAQVVQTSKGPSIVLQGLKGNFNEQQLAMLREQVKQQVLKGNYCVNS